MIEIETKILGFNEQTLRKNLANSSAKSSGKFFLRRWIFDLTKNKNEDEFVRLRTDGNQTTLTYKLRKGTSLQNTEEIEVGVEDFDKAAQLCSKAFGDGYYQENKVEKWILKNVEISINLWPKLPPVLEIEGKSEDEIQNIISELKINGENVGNLGWANLYKRYNLDLHSFKILKF